MPTFNMKKLLYYTVSLCTHFTRTQFTFLAAPGNVLSTTFLYDVSSFLSQLTLKMRTG